jgi:hydroxymethylpyrimidine/phosphomethylpyrimidine kinase
VTVPVALTIAGSDSGGGAGIQADLKTFAALGVYGASVITAVTAQNTNGVAAIHEVPPAFVTAQMDAVLSDLTVNAVKIGMLGNTATIAAVAAGLDRYRQTNVVLDPVLAATSGERLLAADAVEALRTELMPRALLITPNLVEAARLLGEPEAADETAMKLQAERLVADGANAVLLKGGHGRGEESVDILVSRNGITRFAARRIAARNTHGTGCTLASAIASGLAKGQELVTAVQAAKDYVTAAIAAADRVAVGHGRGPLHHFHAWW